MDDAMKIVKLLKDFWLLLKGVSKAIENETKEQRGKFLSMLLGTLGASLIVNLLWGKGVIQPGDGVISAGDKMTSWKDF